MHALGLAVQPNCLKGRVVCGTVYGEMHLKDLFPVKNVTSQLTHSDLIERSQY